MHTRSRVVLGGLLAMLAGCAATQQKKAADFMPPAGEHRLIVMPPDAAVGELTAGGKFRLRQEWSDRSRDQIATALQTWFDARDHNARVARSVTEAGADPAAVASLNHLHDVVGQSIQLHKFQGYKLPTKKGPLDWTLGEQAMQYGQASGYDYALFIHVQDSFASGGRAAVIVGAEAGCMVVDIFASLLVETLCQPPDGGSQRAFASLVELGSGKVVWFNSLWSGFGDTRKEDGARLLVRQLLGSMPKDKGSSGK